MQAPFSRTNPVIQLRHVQLTMVKLRQVMGRGRQLEALTEQYAPVPQLIGRHCPVDVRTNAGVMQLRQLPLVLSNCPQLTLTSLQTPLAKYCLSLQVVVVTQVPLSSVKLVKQAVQTRLQQSQDRQGCMQLVWGRSEKVQPLKTLQQSWQKRLKGHRQRSDWYVMVTEGVMSLFTIRAQQPLSRQEVYLPMSLRVLVGPSVVEEITLRRTGSVESKLSRVKQNLEESPPGVMVKLTFPVWATQKYLMTRVRKMSTSWKSVLKLAFTVRQKGKRRLDSLLKLRLVTCRKQRSVAVTIQVRLHVLPPLQLEATLRVQTVRVLVESMMAMLKVELEMGLLMQTAWMAMVRVVPMVREPKLQEGF